MRDAHLANFGMFAAPDRQLVFDLNDFDETLPGPFEWDVKRLATSVAVVGRVNQVKDARTRRAAAATVASYRATMRRLAVAATLDATPASTWSRSFGGYAKPSWATRPSEPPPKPGTTPAMSRSRSSPTSANGRRFRAEPPLLIPVAKSERAAVMGNLSELFVRYLASLPEDRAVLLLRYGLVDLAHKVVGVGSVGTRALVVLLEAGDHEPLILQVKQAGESALEPYLHRSRGRHAGRRVVTGQRLLQATGDPFLGWTEGSESGMEYYVRQLRDMKGSIEPAGLGAEELGVYGRLCGAVLARAHCRAGDATVISGYLGGSPVFDEAIADFAMSYTDITEADHAVLVHAVRRGSERRRAGRVAAAPAARRRDRGSRTDGGQPRR